MIVKRPYRRTYRQQQARQLAGATQELIAVAARRLFDQRGYVRTTIEAIAKDAGVAVPTVYANFKTKRAILSHIVERLESMDDVSALRQEFAAAPSGSRRQLEIAAAFNSRHYARMADVYQVLTTAGRADPAIAKLLKQREDATRGRIEAVVKMLASARRLRSDIDEKEAADVMFVLGRPAVFYELVHRCGWSPEKYEEWLVNAYESLLIERGVSW